MKLMTCSGLPAKFLAQFGVLGGNSDRAGVEMADAHHDTTAEAISGPVENPNSSAPSSAAHHHIAAGFDLAVGLENNAAAQIVHHENVCCVSATPSSQGSPAIFDGSS